MVTRRSLLAAVSVSLAGCGSTANRSGTDTPRSASTDTTNTPTATDGTHTSTPNGTTDTVTAGKYWYPHPQQTGNRTLNGAGNVRDSSPVTIPAEHPKWLVGLPAPTGSDWVVVTDSGAAVRYRVADGEATRQEEYEPLDNHVPVVRRTDESVDLVRPPEEISPIAPPAFANAGQTRLALGTDGDLLVTDDGSTERVDVGALPDGRIVRVDGDRYALLGDATDRYRHGALGDDVEGGSIVIVNGNGNVLTRTPIGPPAVVEALAPLVGDLDGGGQRELLVPVSDSADGARIVAFAPDGTRLATGPIHGSGWRHPLAIGQFGPNGERELAVVRKPHVEHVLEFYRLDGGLSVRTTLPGFRSHTYNSRNLDGALAADLDDDGAVEVLVPTTQRAALAAVRRTETSAEVVWRLPLGGQLRTNVTGVTLDDGVAVGAGTADGVRIWQG